MGNFLNVLDMWFFLPFVFSSHVVGQVTSSVTAGYDSSIYSYIPNTADMTNEANVQRVMAVLDSNIKQWSFIEAQLLEPNVNLGMPEIFIPLRHLTTTLEVLGNMYFMREENLRARDILERACPLMELLFQLFLKQHQYHLKFYKNLL